LLIREHFVTPSKKKNETKSQNKNQKCKSIVRISPTIV